MPLQHTIDQFLQPWEGPGADECRHRVQTRRWTGAVTHESRYEEVGAIETWRGFTNSIISHSHFLQATLAEPCSDGTFTSLPYVSNLSRIIYNERGLDSLYDKTLMSRVNAALSAVALSQGISTEGMASIVIGPGSFDSFGAEHRAQTTILPDWLVVDGTYNLDDTTEPPPSLAELVAQRRILAVGDTKFTRRMDVASDVSWEPVPGTHSCDKEYLAQLQHYARMLYTRFGFVVTEHELVVAQFLAEEEATPRGPDRRGLRSRKAEAGRQQSMQELRSGGLTLTSSPATPEARVTSTRNYDKDEHEGEREEEEDEAPLPTPTGLGKRQRTDLGRKHDAPSLPVTPSRFITNTAETSQTPRPPISPHRQDRHRYHHHSPDRTPIHRPQLPLDLSPALPSDPPGTTAQTPLSDSLDDIPDLAAAGLTSSFSQYMSSERDRAVGRVLIRSVPIPNTCYRDVQWSGKEDELALHPAKALFALIQLAKQVRRQGRSIDHGVVEF